MSEKNNGSRWLCIRNAIIENERNRDNERNDVSRVIDCPICGSTASFYYEIVRTEYRERFEVYCTAGCRPWETTSDE